MCDDNHTPHTEIGSRCPLATAESPCTSSDENYAVRDNTWRTPTNGFHTHLETKCGDTNVHDIAPSFFYYFF